jgi:hypothetical protein
LFGLAVSLMGVLPFGKMYTGGGANRSSPGCLASLRDHSSELRSTLPLWADCFINPACFYTGAAIEARKSGSGNKRILCLCWKNFRVPKPAKLPAFAGLRWTFGNRLEDVDSACTCGLFVELVSKHEGLDPPNYPDPQIAQRSGTKIRFAPVKVDET